jgi:hypothetical protein
MVQGSVLKALHVSVGDEGAWNIGAEADPGEAAATAEADDTPVQETGS